VPVEVSGLADQRPPLERVVQRVQASPLEAPPYRARYVELTARFVVGPPTAPGNAAAAAGAVAAASAMGAFDGVTVPVFTPATTTARVEVVGTAGDSAEDFPYVVPDGRVLVLRSVGVWGHDSVGQRSAIRWTLAASGRVLTDEQDLGLFTSLDKQAAIQAVVHHRKTITAHVQNRDANSATVVAVRLTGWEYTVDRPNVDTLPGIMDSDELGPRSRSGLTG